MKHNFDEVVNRYQTYCTQWDYIQDRFGKGNILPFSISDTDFKVPVEVYQQLENVMQHQIYGYSRWNHHDFKGAITNYFKHQFSSIIEEDWVLYSPSVLYSISLLFRLLTKPADKVLTFLPMYDAFYNIIQENNRTLVTSKLLEDNGLFYIDFEDLENKIKDVQVVLLCSPHNPTGKVFTEEELMRIISLCKEYNVPIISDEIHMDVIMPGNKHTTIMSFINEYSKIYLASSGSKTFNYPGLIGSYAVISNKEIYDAFIHQTKNKDFLNSVSLLGMHATITSYNHCQYYVTELKEYINNNFNYVEKFIKDNFKDIVFKKPQATYLAWIDCRNLPFTKEQLQDALVNIGGIGIMPGEVYGGKKYLRLNCGCPLSKLEEGMKRFKIAIDSLYKE
ncbi:MAG: MalY/PatB family protein [Coprobacillaceae bacterium]